MWPDFRLVRIGKKSWSNEEILLCPDSVSIYLSGSQPIGEKLGCGNTRHTYPSKMVRKDTGEKMHECLGKRLNREVYAWE